MYGRMLENLIHNVYSKNIEEDFKDLISPFAIYLVYVIAFGVVSLVFVSDAVVAFSFSHSLVRADGVNPAHPEVDASQTGTWHAPEVGDRMSNLYLASGARLFVRFGCVACRFSVFFRLRCLCVFCCRCFSACSRCHNGVLFVCLCL